MGEINYTNWEIKSIHKLDTTNTDTTFVLQTPIRNIMKYYLLNYCIGNVFSIVVDHKKEKKKNK